MPFLFLSEGPRQPIWNPIFVALKFYSDIIRNIFFFRSRNIEKLSARLYSLDIQCRRGCVDSVRLFVPNERSERWKYPRRLLEEVNRQKTILVVKGNANNKGIRKLHIPLLRAFSARELLSAPSCPTPNHFSPASHPPSAQITIQKFARKSSSSYTKKSPRAYSIRIARKKKTFLVFFPTTTVWHHYFDVRIFPFPISLAHFPFCFKWLVWNSTDSFISIDIRVLILIRSERFNYSFFLNKRYK